MTLTAIASAVLAASAALAAPVPGTQGLRFIETAPGKARWMSQPEIFELSRIQHESGRCGGFFDLTDHPAPPVAVRRSFALLADPDPRHQDEVRPLLEEVSAANLVDTVTALSNFHTRYYESAAGAQAAEHIRDKFVALAGGRSDIEVELVPHSWRQPSVRARIRGQGPHASEIVVLGGHEDSINHSGFGARPAERAPGADDDASGTATVIETFRVLAQSGFRPDRTLEFMTYAAEEVGLRGSQDIAQRYRTEGKQVVAALQFDMTGFPGESRELTLITDYVDPALTRFVAKLIDEYVQVPWGEDACGYACSDHASWNRAGFPSAFPFEAPTGEMNRAIHSTRDTLDRLDLEFGAHFAKLGVAFAVELARQE